MLFIAFTILAEGQSSMSCFACSCDVHLTSLLHDTVQCFDFRTTRIQVQFGTDLQCLFASKLSVHVEIHAGMRPLLMYALSDTTGLVIETTHHHETLRLLCSGPTPVMASAGQS